MPAKRKAKKGKGIKDLAARGIVKLLDKILGTNLDGFTKKYGKGKGKRRKKRSLA